MSASRRRFALASILALAILAFPATARADKTCRHVTRDGVEVGVYVWGKTSCPMGIATARKLVRLGYAPRRLRVKSPVTHRWYRLRRVSLDNDFSSYYSAVYHGRGGINVQLQVYY